MSVIQSNYVFASLLVSDRFRQLGLGAYARGNARVRGLEANVGSEPESLPDQRVGGSLATPIQSAFWL